MTKKTGILSVSPFAKLKEKKAAKTTEDIEEKNQKNKKNKSNMPKVEENTATGKSNNNVPKTLMVKKAQRGK